ncbi:MAG: IS66 family insertion sequence element accessory protein TnpB [Gammaproteobacteria bacterium]|nr:IS66 family insertion sequence element accessory protein TnpB [Gammaproteobacteria bacterium]
MVYQVLFVLTSMQTPLNGSVYVFLNKNRNLIKLLHWEHGGYTMYYKRLEKGQFERPPFEGALFISWSTLMMIVEGICLSHTHKKERFFLPENGT